MVSVSRTLCALLCLGLLAAPAAAEPDVAVVALFPGKAVLRVDGARHVLAVGEEIPEGVRLVAADSESAILEISGKQQTLWLSDDIGTVYSQASQRETTVWAGDGNVYRVTGSINGQVVDFVVDTGATSVSMNAQQAQRLGIDFRYLGQPTRIQTAGGVISGYYLTLRQVKVGEIELRDVGAVVLDGGFPEQVLLGMSFLERVEMQRNGGRMTLRQKL